ncbi:MAG: HDIG domain-containing protein [Candidatus Zixiibacteriota bacterium]|nr:MAG: HDIG domain-containing protein [candidate division Zixibacteria bacterium]
MCKISDQVVAAILTRGQIYEVGGAVRDSLLHRAVQPEDRDYLVCGIPYQELSRMLKDFGKVDLVGRSFGVIKFTQYRDNDRYTFDIALPRQEYSTGAGHREFEVSFDSNISIEEDLGRRDFTINAMALSLENQVLIDPHGGQMDLKKKQIRMVSLQAFPEDPLRMLRAVQFAARYEFAIEPETYAALKQHADLIRTVSPERIAVELNKLLVLAEKPSLGLRLMHESGLLREIFPELVETVGVDQPGGYHKYDVFEHSILTVDSAPPRLLVRLAALFHDITKPQTKCLTEDGATFYGHEKTGARVTQEIMKRLRYSADMIRDVTTLVDRHMFTTAVTGKGMRRLIRRVGQSLIFDLLDLRRADVMAQGKGGSTDDVDEFEENIRAELERRPPFGVADLALDGHDIMNIFRIPQSALVGEVLGFLLEKVLDEPEDNTREKLIEYAQSFLANRENK